MSVPPALTLPTLAAGDPVAFEGFVTPFGSAPPDFSAVTLVNPGTANARLHLAWNSPGVTAPFVTPLSPTNVMMTQTMVQSANEHVVQIGGVTEDPGSVTAGLSFVPNASGPLVFVIGHRMSWQFQVYTSFSDFITALNGDLNGTTALLQVAAQGPYNLTTGVMSANLMAVELSD